MHYLPRVARTPAQRGKVGNWLVEHRLARGWGTQDIARAEIERLTGWRIPQSVYAEWESGRRVPSDANLGRLRDFYGDGPVAPIDTDLAAAIRELAAEIRLSRAEDLVSREALMTALGVALSRAGMQGGDGPGRTAGTQ